MPHRIEAKTPIPPAPTPSSTSRSPPALLAGDGEPCRCGVAGDHPSERIPLIAGPPPLEDAAASRTRAAAAARSPAGDELVVGSLLFLPLSPTVHQVIASKQVRFQVLRDGSYPFFILGRPPARAPGSCPRTPSLLS
uniref:Uncharacterized protein n=1 Tax=Oryza barthii TaxID=65489 RepID=A0A0D3GCU6_9ORYZ